MYNSWAWLKVAEWPKFKRARKTGLQFVPLAQAQSPVHGHQQRRRVICGGGSGRRRLLSLRSIVGVGVGGSAGAEGVSVRLVYADRCKSCWRLLLLVRSGLHAVLEVPDLFSLGERLLGLSTFQVCIDVFGVPNVAKVGFKNFAASLEVSSSSWSLASRRTFISILVRGCGVERRLRRLAVKAAGCVLQGPECNFSFLRGVLVSKCCKLLYQ